MKRIFIAIVLVLLVFSICSCNGSHFDEPEETPEASETVFESESQAPETEPESEPESEIESESEVPVETEPPKIEYSDEPLKVMSYNVYTSSPDRTRVKKVVGNINSYDPDVIGVQEFNYSWSVVLGMVAADFNKTYEMVGEPRLEPSDKSNNNEYSAIFYKKDKFNLIETDTYWLSDTPDKVSKFEGTEYYRIMTYAVLERKSDGARFIHFNTHIATDEVSRHKQIEVLLALAGTVLEKHGDLPLYFTGDFNMTPGDAGYGMMLDWLLEDTRHMIEPVNTKPTCGNSRIDYCFVSKGDFTVKAFDVGYGLEGSDHNLVYAEIGFKTE